MLLASSMWVFPQPVVAKTKASLPEANKEIKQEVKEPYGPIRPTISLGQSKKLSNRPELPQVKTNRVETTLRNSAGSEGTVPKVGAYNGRNYSKEEVQALIIQYSQQYGINPAVPLCIARLESGYNQFSANKSSSARGVFQYLSGTWRATDEGKLGISVFDADANVKAAVKYMASRKSTKPWVVGPKCPSL
jgi:soluble lytic murein transglycosylase-like protein